MRFVTTFAVATGAACAGPERAAGPEGAPPALSDVAPSLLECPVSAPRHASAVITPAQGGTVALQGFSVSVPAGAVREPRTITLRVPESRYFVVDVRVEGEEHFVLQAPAVVTLDYRGCHVPASRLGRLTAWHVDGDTTVPLQNTRGVDDRPSRRITFATLSLSGYAIHNRTATDSTGSGG